MREPEHGNRKWKFIKKGWPSKEKLTTSYNHFQKALVKRGFEHLGSGAYSSVYAKPGQARVIKVTRRPDNWIDYIRWAAQQGQGGKLAPQVFSYKVYNEGTDRVFTVSIVERLEKELGKVDRKEPIAMLSCLLEEYAYYGNPKALDLIDVVKPDMGEFLKGLTEKFGGKYVRDNAFSFDYKPEGEGKGRLDLHNGNIMFRADGSICISDPVCGKRVSADVRFKAGDFSPVLSKFRKTIIEGSFRHRM